MSHSSQHNGAPGIMLIMRSVAKAAGMTTADIIDGKRYSELCYARAAVYKIARLHGYTKDEIMYFLDRNRTGAYNLETNIAGHLSKSAYFKNLCDAATSLLAKYPYRDVETRQNAIELATEASEQSEIHTDDSEPVFTDWNGQLGWTFTAEECRREWYAKRAAEEFMKTYGQEPHVQRRDNDPKPREVPKEMTTAEAVIYLGVSAGILVKGVQLGRLHRFKKPLDTSYWFYTAELDRYRIYLEQTNKRINPKY